MGDIPLAHSCHTTRQRIPTNARPCPANPAALALPEYPGPGASQRRATWVARALLGAAGGADARGSVSRWVAVSHCCVAVMEGREAARGNEHMR